MNPGGQPARLPVVQPTLGINRDDGVVAIKVFGIDGGPVASRVASIQPTRKPVPDLVPGPSNQPRSRPQKTLARNLRECVYQVLRKNDTESKLEHIADSFRILAANVIQIAHIAAPPARNCAAVIALQMVSYQFPHEQERLESAV
jgi:hypothetical protein